MQVWKHAYVNQREVPVLISDEKEALLAAKAAGRALIGLWRPDQEMDAIAAAKYVVDDVASVTEEYLERVARRHLGLPWRICETERLVIREMFADDFDEVWEHQIGLGFGSVEELQAYTKNQYSFYEFGFWALVEKNSGELIGVAGLKVPDEVDTERMELWKRNLSAVVSEVQQLEECGETLELGYHIFRRHRRNGYAEEACRAILQYGIEELGVSEVIARIEKENMISKEFAKKLGFSCVEI